MPPETLCFVDDDPEEVRRFRHLLGSRFHVAGGTTLEAALADLSARGLGSPDVFVLDLYFAEGSPSTEAERGELAEAWARFLEAKAQLGRVLRRLRQTPEGGLRLARRIREERPAVPIAFFTRKGTLEDAAEALDEGAAAILKKPDPDERERRAWSGADALDAALARDLPRVVRGLERALASRRGRK